MLRSSLSLIDLLIDLRGPAALRATTVRERGRALSCPDQGRVADDMLRKKIRRRRGRRGWGLASTKPLHELTGPSEPLPLVALRRGRRTALILPLFPPPQKNRS